MAVDQLKSVVLSLNEEEKKEFRVFAQRQRSKDKRRDLELFEIIIADPEKKPRLIIQELYGKENREAYNMLRKTALRGARMARTASTCTPSLPSNLMSQSASSRRSV